ncbi:autotransporter assembly complex protein TamA [Desulfonatronovibrio magnus]|uniref:autotransporter assembly complex protein TamA n=1 Tax=Desulfonatronovibrio magnus TaxID=698827 RepID=UPI000A01C421|nr:autotransporter assembly complex family protein [Desulfonatronovibrio magnus]
MIKIIIICFFSFFFSFSAFAQENDIPGMEISSKGISYTVVFTGEMSSRIRQVLNQVSETVTLKNRPPMTEAQLRRRAEHDLDEFTRALRSFGYYRSSNKYFINTTQSGKEVEFSIDTGPAYVIRNVHINNICPEMTPLPEIPSMESLGLTAGSSIESAKVLSARQVIMRSARAHGFPFPFVELGEVLIDHKEQIADIVYNVDPGPRAVFGETEIQGLSRVKPEYVYEKIPWEKGKPFSAPQLNELRRKLTGTGLFATVDVGHAQELDEDGSLPMYIQVNERRPRTARAGVGYQTDIGPELKLGWMHRNLRGKGERLEFDLGVSDVQRIVEGTYTIPSFFHPDQNLVLKAGLDDESKDAYDSRSVYSSAMVERRFSEQLSVGAGVGYRAAQVKQFGETTDLRLAFFPATVTWDGRDDILNPGTGIRANVRLTPFIDTLDSKTRFIKSYASLNTYLEILDDKRLVLAGRGALGAINAESNSKVPPDERFYAGGGGSVRGYSYQSAGRMTDKKPVGGLSLAELNAEIRLKLAQRHGLVAFVDGGRAFDSSYPDFDQRLFWGYGVGYRFFTDFGPIRADIAFPLNRRKGVDDSFQLYISIGQSF